MISYYRLGDLVLLGLYQREKELLVNEYNDSIGADFIRQFEGHENKIALITKIIGTYLQKYQDKMPVDIENSTVVHIRLGDVVAGTEWHECKKRPLSIEHIKSVLNTSLDKTYIIGKPFFAEASSKNQEECIEKSQSYMNELLFELNAEHFDGGHADIDLCCAVKAKTFVQGKGYFSQLIVDIRKYLQMHNIETNCLD
jgi:hypothetical protein